MLTPTPNAHEALGHLLGTLNLNGGQYASLNEWYAGDLMAHAPETAIVLIHERCASLFLLRDDETFFEVSERDTERALIFDAPAGAFREVSHQQAIEEARHLPPRVDCERSETGVAVRIPGRGTRHVTRHDAEWDRLQELSVPLSHRELWQVFYRQRALRALFGVN